MKRWWLVILLLFSLGVNVGILATLAVNRMERGAAVEERRPGPESPPAEPRLEREVPMPRLHRLADHLGMQGEDRELFLRIQREFFERMFRHRRELEEARRELRRELGSSEPSRERAEALLQRSAAAHAEIERALIDNVLRTREILAPEQQREFTRIVQHIVRGRGGERAGPFRRGDRPPFRGPERRGDRGQKRTPP